MSSYHYRDHTWAEDEFYEVEPGTWQCDFQTGMGSMKIEVNFKGMCVTIIQRSGAKSYALDVVDGRIRSDTAMPMNDWDREWAKLNERYSEWLSAKMLG